MTFSRPHYYRVSGWNFRVLSVLGTSLVSGFGLEFPCFGGFPSIEESVRNAKQLWYLGKSYNLGGFLSFFLLLIARAEFKPHSTVAKTSTAWGLGVRK